MPDEKIQVLLFESDPQDARLIQNYLTEGKRALFDVLWVDNLREGLDKLDAGETYDVILLDPELPDSQGVDSLKAVEERCRRVPVIPMTRFKDGGEGTEVNSQAPSEDRFGDHYWLPWAIQYALARKHLEQIFPA